MSELLPIYKISEHRHGGLGAFRYQPFMYSERDDAISQAWELFREYGWLSHFRVEAWYPDDRIVIVWNSRQEAAT